MKICTIKYYVLLVIFIPSGTPTLSSANTCFRLNFIYQAKGGDQDGCYHHFEFVLQYKSFLRHQCIKKGVTWQPYRMIFTCGLIQRFQVFRRYVLQFRLSSTFKQMKLCKENLHHMLIYVTFKKPYF